MLGLRLNDCCPLNDLSLVASAYSWGIVFYRSIHFFPGTVISAAYSTGDAFSCFDQSATDITLTCTVANTLVGSVVWSRDTTAMTTCSFTVDNTCLPSPGFSEPRYSFTSDVGQKKFYLTITSVSSSSDFVSFTCEHGIGDDGSFSVRECVGKLIRLLF